MNDAAKKVASTAGAKGAKGKKETNNLPDVTPAGQSMAELDAMLAAAKPGATPSLVARAHEIEAEKAVEAEVPVRIYAPEEQHCGLIATHLDGSQVTFNHMPPRVGNLLVSHPVLLPYLRRALQEAAAP